MSSKAKSIVVVEMHSSLGEDRRFRWVGHKNAGPTGMLKAAMA